MDLPIKYDAIYLMDVLEHIEKLDEEIFIKNIIKSLDPKGVLMVGMPSLESQVYASEISKMGHVNCKTGNELKELFQKYFHQVMISMNDEVVHTQFSNVHY